MTTLVVAVGHPDRSDDACGLAVADELRRRRLPDVSVVTAASPTVLLDGLSGYQQVVVVDAVRGGHSAGTVTVSLLDDALLPARPGDGGSHGFGLAETVELARALGRLPARIVVVGIEPACLDAGAPMSAEVTAAITRAADIVARLSSRVA